MRFYDCMQFYCEKSLLKSKVKADTINMLTVYTAIDLLDECEVDDSNSVGRHFLIADSENLLEGTIHKFVTILNKAFLA